MCKIQKRHTGGERHQAKFGDCVRVYREKGWRAAHGEAAARPRSNGIMTVSPEGLSGAQSKEGQGAGMGKRLETGFEALRSWC